MNKVVYTSITGGKDELIQKFKNKGAKFVAFTNQESDSWEVRKPFKKFKNRRYNYKPPKILPHLYFSDVDYSLWLNGCMATNYRADTIIKGMIGDDNPDMVLFEHWEDRGVYKEIEIERKKRKDNLEDLDNLERFLKKQKMPAGIKMVDCGLILRKHNDIVEQFNNEWMSLIVRFTQRDQTLFNYLRWKYKDKIKIKSISRNYRNHKWFKWEGHKDPNPTK